MFHPKTDHFPFSVCNCQGDSSNLEGKSFQRLEDCFFKKSYDLAMASGSMVKLGGAFWNQVCPSSPEQVRICPVEWMMFEKIVPSMNLDLSLLMHPG